MKLVPLIATLPLIGLAGCNPTVTVKQDKPFEVNINLKGQLDVVIHDAQSDLQQIKGTQPRNQVNLEDIGISEPASGTGTAPGALSADPFPTFSAIAAHPGTLAAQRHGGTIFTASADDLRKSMHARDAAVQALWDQGLVGESHTGLLVAKGALSPEQQKTMDAENADRTALYAAEAKDNGKAEADVALGHYVARLGYANKGAWYEKKNAAGTWEWVQWSK